MSDLWLPPSARTNVQIGEKQRVCVLTHADTGRILCFCLDDPFARKLTGEGFILHEIHHAHEYDMWAKRIRQQQAQENEIEDQAYLERENTVRSRLRQQLRDRLNVLTVGAERQAVESALHCLDLLQKRKERRRAESFMVAEAYDSTEKNVGDDLVNKIMVPKQ